VPGDRRAARVGGRERAEDADGGGLAGAVRAEQTEHLALVDGERDARERGDLLVALLEPFDGDHVHEGETNYCR
jgi:hypothetical protein